MKKLLLAAVVGLMASVSACDDNSGSIGSSLVGDSVEIVVDSVISIQGHSVESPSVEARTVLQLLGRLSAGEYGAFESTVVTQFFPAQTLITEGVTPETVDSVKLIMRMPMGGFVGDSSAVMGITAYPLLPDALNPGITSAFNPAGKYDGANPLASVMYSMTGGNVSKSETAGNYRLVEMKLDKKFGQRLLEKYKESPEIFSSPSAFSKWFPGLCLANTFGSGRVAQIDSTVITMYYRQILPVDDAINPRDTTIYRSNSYLAVSPEVLTNNCMSYAMSNSLKQMAANGDPILVAPTGYDIEMHFPAQDIIDSYRSQNNALTVVNTLSLSVPVDEIANDFGIAPPPYVLLVKKSMKDDFFAKSLLPDNINSFYASYDSYNRRYVFNDMRSYLLELLDKDAINADDEEFIICPVTIGLEKKTNTGSSYYYYYYSAPQASTMTVASVTPYVNRPAMARLALDRAKITFTYSVQNLNF